jgi:hypothetical protein
MWLKPLVLSAGCLLTWLLLPVVAIGGAMALFVYALLVELAQLLSGTTEKNLDPNAAHEMAVRICGGFAPPRVA